MPASTDRPKQAAWAVRHRCLEQRAGFDVTSLGSWSHFAPAALGDHGVAAGKTNHGCYMYSLPCLLTHFKLGWVMPWLIQKAKPYGDLGQAPLVLVKTIPGCRDRELPQLLEGVLWAKSWGRRAEIAAKCQKAVTKSNSHLTHLRVALPEK